MKTERQALKQAQSAETDAAFSADREVRCVKFSEREAQPVPPEADIPARAHVPLEECGEPLVPCSLFPSRILVRSWYFGEGLDGSLPEAWLRESVFEKLISASRELPDGYHFVIWDGWRSLRLQASLFGILRGRIKEQEPGLSDEEAGRRASVFVAVPSTEPDSLSGHLSGGAVDLTISDDFGRYLDMGSGFDEPTELSFTDYYERIENPDARQLKVRANRRILRSLMSEAGLDNYPQEWWHFDYGNRNWAIRTGAPCAIYGYVQPPFRWRLP